MTRQLALVLLCAGAAAAQGVGIFENHADIGETPRKGSVEYNAGAGEYRITGGGANVWASTDAFQFAWRRVSGDVTITADIEFVGKGAVEHRKAMLMVRQNLNPDSAYADVARHGVGLTSLQFRPTAAAVTQEIRSTVDGPVRVRIERHGNEFTIFAGKPGEELTRTGPATVALQDPVYVGLGVCSHDANILETAVFTNVKIDPPPPPQRAPQTRYRSKISIYDFATKAVKVIFTADETWEAPNWTVDGRYLLVNSGGGLFKLAADVEGAKPEKLDVGADVRCNNDHGFTRDGQLLAFSASSGTSRGSEVFIVSADGKDRRQVTNVPPSYFHGWSPDGKWLAVVAQRNNNFDLFRIPVTGGTEQHLTTDPAYDDGPDYSPDGKWIYFNSNRAAGDWDIWRMPADGAGPNDSKAERVTSDEWEDWFPHPSPNGKMLLFLSFPKGTTDHNGKMDIQLRMIPMPGKKVGSAKPQTVLQLFGGQGTINVNSWSPDSKRFAFVSYEKLP
jgi:Tol biopolymer transport system component